MERRQRQPERPEVARPPASEAVTQRTESRRERAERDAERIRREAERDADAIRAEAIASAERLLDRLRALEFPLGQLVVSLREEIDYVADELEGGAKGGAERLRRRSEESVGSGVDAGEHDPAPAGARSALPRRGERGDSERREPTHIAPEATQPPPPAAFDQPDVGTPKTGGRLRRFTARHAKQETFIGEAGACAICQRGFQAAGESELARSGWTVRGDVGLCPDCQADRWQLPEGARTPFRRGG